MKRLPFALLALSLCVPAVACLSAASDDGEAASDALSDATKKACNFNFKAVDADAGSITINAAKAQGFALGSRILLGDFDGDAKIDFASADAYGVQVFKGSGDGHFTAGAKTAIPVADGRTRVALATVAVGDFDGDKKQDVVLLDTTADANNAMRGDFSIMYGRADGSLAIAGDATALGSVTENTYYHVAGDLDGDGKDDLAYTTLTADAVVFGSADRKLVAGKTGLATGGARGLAFIQAKTATKPAALVIQTTGNVSTVSFDATRKGSTAVADSAAIPKGDSRFGTDLDSNGQPEVTILGSDGLSIKPVGGGVAFSIANFPGRAIGAFDLAGTKMQELVYIVNESQVFAACGYAADAKDLGTVQLPIPYGNGGFIAGTMDINGDKQVDFLTVDANGALGVFLGAGASDPAPQISLFTAGGHPGGGSDSGADGATSDALTDASTDASSADAGSDAGTKAGGHDGGAGSYDAGTTKPNGAGNQGTEAPPSEEGSGVGDPGGDGVQTTPSSGGSDEGTPLVAVIPKPDSVAACSTTPGTHGATTSAFGALFGAMLLLARRRRRA